VGSFGIPVSVTVKLDVVYKISVKFIIRAWLEPEDASLDRPVITYDAGPIFPLADNPPLLVLKKSSGSGFSVSPTKVEMYLWETTCQVQLPPASWPKFRILLSDS
jgi:hypothetical protein